MQGETDGTQGPRACPTVPIQQNAPTPCLQRENSLSEPQAAEASIPARARARSEEPLSLLRKDDRPIGLVDWRSMRRAAPRSATRAWLRGRSAARCYVPAARAAM